MEPRERRGVTPRAPAPYRSTEAPPKEDDDEAAHRGMAVSTNAGASAPPRPAPGPTSQRTEAQKHPGGDTDPGRRRRQPPDDAIAVAGREAPGALDDRLRGLAARAPAARTRRRSPRAGGPARPALATRWPAGEIVRPASTTGTPRLQCPDRPPGTQIRRARRGPAPSGPPRSVPRTVEGECGDGVVRHLRRKRRPALREQARDVHLGDPETSADVRLGHVGEVPQQEDPPFTEREP